MVHFDIFSKMSKTLFGEDNMDTVVTLPMIPFHIIHIFMRVRLVWISDYWIIRVSIVVSILPRRTGVNLVIMNKKYFIHLYSVNFLVYF